MTGDAPDRQSLLYAILIIQRIAADPEYGILGCRLEISALL
jgi:hypothetical protein